MGTLIRPEGMRSTTARLLLALALATGLAAPAGAQPPAPTGTPAPLAEAASPRPAIQFGPDTPRGAMARFLEASRAGRYARAAEYMNLRQLPRELGTVHEGIIV